MTELIGVAAVAVVAWFAAGTIWNVRLGRETLRWLQDGLPLLGARTTLRWLGSSVVEMVIRDPRAPFASAALLVFLEPRDLPWWPLSHARGRRDTLIIRGNLKKAPAVQFEALEPGSWSGREALPRVPREWTVHAGTLTVYHPVEAKPEAEALLALARRVGLQVRRLSVRRDEPHFQLHVALPGRDRPAREFFEAAHALAEGAGSGRTAGAGGAPA
jgi:hypothetical protein